MMILRESDSGKTIELGSGQLFRWSLSENPTTGYRWEVQTNSGLAQNADHYAAAGSGIGGGGVRTFDFVASQPGTFELVLVCKRSWERSSDGERTVRLRVAVGG